MALSVAALATRRDFYRRSSPALSYTCVSGGQEMLDFPTIISITLYTLQSSVMCSTGTVFTLSDYFHAEELYKRDLGEWPVEIPVLRTPFKY